MMENQNKGKSFENEIADIYRLLGYEVEQNIYISGKKIDIFATYVLPLTGNKARILIECKNWKNHNIGNKLVLQFAGLVELARKANEADYAEFVTKSDYSEDAKSIAQKAGIKLLTYNQLLSKIINFDQYLKLYIEDFEKDPLFKNYINLNFYKLEETTQFKEENKDSKIARLTIEQYLDEWLKSGFSEYITILADYGMGKTSLCRYFTYLQAKKFLNDPQNERIPVLISLKEFYNRFEIESMVTNFLVNRCGICTNYLAFKKLLLLGKAVIILDGFDEMAQQVDKEVRKKNFQALTELALPNNKVIITGRPNYFVNKQEMDEIFSQNKEEDIYKQITDELRNTPAYEILYLELFNEKQIDQLLEKQSEFLKKKGITDWSELKKTINSTYNLSELAKRPFLLDMIIKSIPKIKGKVKEINAGKLYDIYTSEWIDREYRKGEFRELIKKEDKKTFVYELAWQMTITNSPAV